MKNTRDTFDDELKNRLENYSEEPGDQLWTSIASQIPQITPEPVWIKWTTRAAMALVILSAALLIYPSIDDHSELAESEVQKTIQEKAFQKTVPSTERIAENNASEKTGTEFSEATRDKAIPAITQDKSRAANEGSASAYHLPNDNSVNQSEIKRVEQKSEGRQISSTHDNKTTLITSNNEDRNLQSELPGIVKSEDTEGAVKPVTIAATDPKRNSTIDPDSVQLLTVVTDSALKVTSEEPEEKKENKTKERKLALYFTAMPTLGYQRIEANKNDNVIIESFSKVSNFSAKRLGIRAELGAEYPVSKRTRIFGGILYYQRKQTLDYVQKISTGNTIDNATDNGFTIEPQFSHEQRSFSYELKNIGLQIGLNYVLSEGKFLHVAGTGMEFHKALNKLPSDEQLEGLSRNPSTYVFYNLYYRVQYPAQGKLKGIFQPTFNYSLYLNKDMNAPFYVKPYGLGLNLGLTYNF